MKENSDWALLDPFDEVVIGRRNRSTNLPAGSHYTRPAYERSLLA